MFSVEDPSARHSNVTLNLLTKQIAYLSDPSDTLITIREGTNLHIRRQLNYLMQARQLLSIYSSKLLFMKHGEKLLHNSLMKKVKLSPYTNHLRTHSLLSSPVSPNLSWTSV